MRRPFQHGWIVQIPYWPLWPGAVGPHAAPAPRPPIRRSLNGVGAAKGDLAVGERPYMDAITWTAPENRAKDRDAPAFACHRPSLWPAPALR